MVKRKAVNYSMKHEPYHTIIAHEIIKSNLEHFKESFSNRGDLRWVKGVLFFQVGFPDTNEVVADALRGILHWNLFHFTKMPEYEDQITSNNRTAKVYDNSNNKLILEFIKFLKKDPVWLDD
ncbi:MAG: hypothetical protein ACR2P9_08685 [Gammaproteobacteria bacterium]